MIFPESPADSGAWRLGGLEVATRRVFVLRRAGRELPSELSLGDSALWSEVSHKFFVSDEERGALIRPCGSEGCDPELKSACAGRKSALPN